MTYLCLSRPIMSLSSPKSFFFFFSSRRRHTRLSGDRSSDVCSSDLGLPINWRGLQASPMQFGESRATRSSMRMAQHPVSFGEQLSRHSDTGDFRSFACRESLIEILEGWLVPGMQGGFHEDPAQ